MHLHALRKFDMRFSSALAGVFVIVASSLANAQPAKSAFYERSLARGLAAGLPLLSTRQESETSGNWAGVVLKSPPSPEQNFTEVAGKFTVPSLPDSIYTAACAWIGIDGYTENGHLFQAGLDFWNMDGELTYNAWYEWVPDTSWNFTQEDIGTLSAGDVISIRLVAHSDTTGTIYLENETTGIATTKELKAPPIPNAPLTMKNAEWIMEDFFWYGQVPLADFGSVSLENDSHDQLHSLSLCRLNSRMHLLRQTQAMLLACWMQRLSIWYWRRRLVMKSNCGKGKR